MVPMESFSIRVDVRFGLRVFLLAMVGTPDSRYVENFGVVERYQSSRSLASRSGWYFNLIQGVSAGAPLRNRSARDPPEDWRLLPPS